MLANLVVPIEPFWTAQQETLFFQVRLPRIALALLGLLARGRRRSVPGHVPEPARVPRTSWAPRRRAAFGAAVAILLGLGALGISRSRSRRPSSP